MVDGLVECAVLCIGDYWLMFREAASVGGSKRRVFVTVAEVVWWWDMFLEPSLLLE